MSIDRKLRYARPPLLPRVRRARSWAPAFGVGGMMVGCRSARSRAGKRTGTTAAASRWCPMDASESVRRGRELTRCSGDAPMKTRCMKPAAALLAGSGALLLLHVGAAVAGPCTAQIDAVAKSLASNDAGAGPTAG